MGVIGIVIVSAFFSLLICSYELLLIKAFRFSVPLSEQGDKTYICWHRQQWHKLGSDFLHKFVEVSKRCYEPKSHIVFGAL